MNTFIPDPHCDYTAHVRACVCVCEREGWKKNDRSWNKETGDMYLT